MSPTTLRPWAVLVLVLAVTAAVRWRWLDVPLERDEGEYAYAGQLLLDGVPPYGAAYNMKFPGTYVAYAAILGVFGQTAHAVHLGLLIVNGAAIVLVFLLGRRLHGDVAAAAAALFYAILSIGPATLGMAAHATQFLVPPVLAGFLLLLREGESRRFEPAAAGICFGLAILAKQPAIAFLALGLLLAYRRRRSIRDAGLVAAGAVAPLVLTAAWLWMSGVFDRFWFWTIRYASAYATEVTLALGWDRLSSNFGTVLKDHAVLWALAGAGLVLSVLRRRVAPHGAFLAWLAVFSFLSTCPGLFFRPHYFVAMLPAAALLSATAAAVAIEAIATRAPALPKGAIAAVVLLGLSAATTWGQAEFLPGTEPARVSFGRYRGNPFSEAPAIARYVEERTRPDDRIAIVGSEPEIYFYAHRRSATGYIYTYALMENQPFAETMRREMIAEIEAAKPAYLIVVTNKYSWLKHPDSSTAIFDWVREYMNAQYTVEALLWHTGTAESEAIWSPREGNLGDVGPESVVIARRLP